MPDKKLTDNLANNSPILSNGLSDNEKAKALECCIVGDCDNCPYDEQTACKEYLLQDAINELNRLQAENEELVHKLECLLCHSTGGKLSKHTYPLDAMERCVNDTIQEYCEEAQAEARKEFAEKLIKEINVRTTFSKKQDKNVLFYIDNLLKELESGA